MESQVKRVERPDKAKSQKTITPLDRITEARGKEVRTHSVTSRHNVDVCQRSPKENRNHGPEGTRRFVDVGEDGGGVSSLSEGCESSRAGVDARQTNGEDGNANGDIHEVVQTPDTGILEGDDERRGGSTTTTEKSRLIVTDEETNDGEGANVDEGLKSSSETTGKVFLDIENSRYARRFP
jgi:hypothetical protein